MRILAAPRLLRRPWFLTSFNAFAQGNAKTILLQRKMYGGQIISATRTISSAQEAVEGGNLAGLLQRLTSELVGEVKTAAHKYMSELRESRRKKA